MMRLMATQAEAGQLSLVHNAKQPSSFNSEHWRRGYNPNLAFVSHKIAPLSTKMILEPNPRSQHRPIGIKVKAAIAPTSKIFHRRFNFKRANWKRFKHEVEHKLENIDPIPENYDRFANVVGLPARHNIPCGCHSYCIPGLTPSDKDLYSK